jgi:deoxycytidylate deaminase
MRQSYGHGVLAELAVRDIRRDRQENGMENATGRYLPRRVCHIIDSIKNEAELELLKTVYRETLYVVGVFSPVSNREASLKQKGLTNTEVAELMDKDSGEEKPEGQMVSDIFPQCDFFLRMDSNTSTQLNARVERFLNLILGAQIVTPTRAEMAMYAAASAATNSACLSRQVGAAVTDANGNLLATGWNDVPKAFGDLYVTDLKGDPTNIHDKRCWNYGGKCYNDEEKTLLAEHIVQTLEQVLPPDKKEAAIQAVMADKKLRGLIEFSRSIHAEMHAILTALRLEGSRVRGGQLFVTTYPCHSCARHIIAAGIKEVYYIEPYKKSLATKLHGEAMTEDEQSTDKVKLISYDGVAPTRYLSLFRMEPDSRKKHGKVIQISPSNASPRLKKSLEALPALESLVVASLRQKKLLNDEDLKPST